MRRILGAAAGMAALGLAAGPAMADEGMWTFDNFPMARVNAAYGTSIDQAWLDKVQAASVRIPGCSASVVSGQGLVMTNYHCLESCAGSLRRARRADTSVPKAGGPASPLVGAHPHGRPGRRPNEAVARADGVVSPMRIGSYRRDDGRPCRPQRWTHL